MDERYLKRAHRYAIASACGYLFLLLALFTWIIPKIVILLAMPAALISNLLIVLQYRKFQSSERTCKIAFANTICCVMMILAFINVWLSYYSGLTVILLYMSIFVGLLLSLYNLSVVGL